jgi:plasmid maintenance system antidote protein VapI
MNFVFNIGEKKRITGRYIGSVRRQLTRAVLKAEERGISRSDIARKIGCHRSRITRMLTGSSNLTLRSISELSWAIGKKPLFSMEDIIPISTSANDVRVQWDYEQSDPQNSNYRPMRPTSPQTNSPKIKVEEIEANNVSTA